MIDETLEVKEYLHGQNLNPNNLYRICYLLTKWYGEQGMDNLSIREAIFKWANTYNVYIKYNINDIIKCANADKRRLTAHVAIHVCPDDIAQIKKRFDRPKIRLTALALLCFAKAHADKDGVFTVSSVALGAWLGIHRSTLQRQYIQELRDFKYLEVVKPPCNSSFAWNRIDTYAKSTHYKLLVPLRDDGEFVMEDNDILKFYHQIFI